MTRGGYMLKFLQISIILLFVVSLISGCGNTTTSTPTPFKKYCGFSDAKEPLPEPCQVTPPPPPPPEPKPELAPVEEVVEPEKVVLRGINFDFDKSDIKPEFVPVLDEAVEILKANPEINVIIEGHTCSMGPEKYNQGLSMRRANSVFNYLTEKGISGDRLKTIGYGETMPIADNSTLEGRRMNRRVEFKIVD